MATAARVAARVARVVTAEVAAVEEGKAAEEAVAAAAAQEKLEGVETEAAATEAAT